MAASEVFESEEDLKAVELSGPKTFVDAYRAFSASLPGTPRTFFMLTNLNKSVLLIAGALQVRS